jgi:hypothetical protein
VGASVGGYVVRVYVLMCVSIRVIQRGAWLCVPPMQG